MSSPRATVRELSADLAAEHADLSEMLGTLDEGAFATSTASPGWSVADQIAHLAWFDRAATSAIMDPEGFAARVTATLATVEPGADFATELLAGGRALAPADLLSEWRAAARELVAATAFVADGTRLPWYGPSMGAVSFLTARLMETWAHGQDVADALGLRRVATDRLRHVAQLGVLTYRWSFSVRGLPVPDARIAVDLELPGGARFVTTAGSGPPPGSGSAGLVAPEGSGSFIAGSAFEFCLVVTQRRHISATGLTVGGPEAAAWMEVAQAFAGPPTEGPRPER